MKHILPWLLFPLILSLFLAVAYLPLPVPAYLDFQVIYHAAMALVHGIPLYDHVGQVKLIADLAGVQAEQVFVLPFPYPPWYALAAVPLVFLPINVAARFWLELNVTMLMLSTFLLTEGWKPWKRLAAFPLALTFLPVLGSLYVGQYIFPVLLGAAVFVYSLRHEQPFLIALAAALLTFKPHLGTLILLAGLIHLWLRSDVFGKRSLWMTSFAGAILFGIGFLADPLWPLNYLKSLTEFHSIKEVTSCDLCASLPVMLSNLTGPAGSRSSFWIAEGVLLVLFWFIYRKRQKLFSLPDRLVGIFALVTLLASPYLLNYDFVLLLIPLMLIAGKAYHWHEWSLIGFVILIPWLGLGLFGRQGNVTLVVSTLLLAGGMYQQGTKRFLD